MKCVELLDDNYGDYKTGYVQYLFLANDVSSTCVDTIKIKRSQDFEECPNCKTKFKIQVMNIEPVSPTETVVETSIIVEGDSDAIKAAKTLCQEDDQTYWNRNINECESKCLDHNRPWFNVDTSECESPNVVGIMDNLFSNTQTSNTMDIFSAFGKGGFSLNTPSFAAPTVTTTTKITVPDHQKCTGGTYYSFIKKKCVKSAASAVVTRSVPVKTEAEKVKEKADEATKAFAAFAAAFNTPTQKEGEEEKPAPVKIDDATPDKPTTNPFAAFGGNASAFTPSLPTLPTMAGLPPPPPPPSASNPFASFGAGTSMFNFFGRRL